MPVPPMPNQRLPLHLFQLHAKKLPDKSLQSYRSHAFRKSVAGKTRELVGQETRRGTCEPKAVTSHTIHWECRSLTNCPSTPSPSINAIWPLDRP